MRFVAYILEQTRRESLVYIGHSQGCAAILVALASRPHLSSRFYRCVLLSPGAFVRPLKFNRWLAAVTSLYARSRNEFRLVFGENALIRPMEWSRILLPSGLLGWMGSLMFWHLFHWSTRLWDKEFEPIYFQGFVIYFFVVN